VSREACADRQRIACEAQQIGDEQQQPATLSGARNGMY